MNRVVIMGIVFLVDFLLLHAASHLGQGRNSRRDYLVGAFLDACVAAAGMLPCGGLLRAWSVHILCLVLVGIVAYGVVGVAWLRTGLFVVLHLSLGQATAEGTGMLRMLLGSVGIFAGCRLLNCAERYVPVELCYGDVHMRIRALRDTGNALIDPVSGQPVLIVSCEVAGTLTGLTREQLADPIRSLGMLPGLRLIPYRTVSGTGLLLGMRVTGVRIGNWHGNRVVAFSPQILSKDFQALTGGIL